MTGCAILKKMSHKIGFLQTCQKLFVVRKLTFENKVDKIPHNFVFNESRTINSFRDRLFKVSLIFEHKFVLFANISNLAASTYKTHMAKEYFLSTK